MPRTRVRPWVLVTAVATVVVATSVTAVVADGILRSQIEAELRATNTSVQLTLGGGSVLWSYLTGTMHFDAHLGAEAMQNAISAKAGIGIGDISLADGAIVATLDSSPVTALLGGDVALELAPHAVDGKLSVAISGMTIGGEVRGGMALADRIGPFVIDPAEVMDCVAASEVVIDDAAVRDGELVVGLTIPKDSASTLAECR